MSHQKICTFSYCVFNDEVPSTSSQIVEQFEVIQEIVLPGISKLNGSASKQETRRRNTVFTKKKL